MSSFTDKLVLSPAPYKNRPKWVLQRDFSFYIGGDKNTTVTARKGFLTDSATIPRLLWSVFPPFGQYGRAAIIHDRLYDNPVYSLKTASGSILMVMDRSEADKVFLEAMTVSGVTPITKYILYYAVRLFGKNHWVKV